MSHLLSYEDSDVPIYHTMFVGHMTIQNSMSDGKQKFMYIQQNAQYQCDINILTNLQSITDRLAFK